MKVEDEGRNKKEMKQKKNLLTHGVGIWTLQTDFFKVLLLQFLFFTSHTEASDDSENPEDGKCWLCDVVEVSPAIFCWL